MSKVPREVAVLLEKEDPTTYTFHSLRRSSATAAADGGASVQQLMDFYGWQNTNMSQEYVSSSKVGVKSMAERIQGATGEVSGCKLSEQTKKFQSSEKPEKIIIIKNFSGTIQR